MDSSFLYSFPAIRGVQARRDYYVSMCPLRLIPRIFSFDEEELAPELRAQRVLNHSRIPEMARYIVANREDYCFSALTVSLDAEVLFEPVPGAGDSRVGILKVPMDARFIINDGQHRRAAIEAALREDPALADETIAVVFFMDKQLQRCQQMFADLNRYAIRTSSSIGVLYDHRDHLALLVKRVVFGSPYLKDLVELERSTLSMRSRKLFTLSAVYRATKALLVDREGHELDELTEMVAAYWEKIANLFPEWRQVHNRELTSGEVRRDFIHAHGIALHALGRLGSELLQVDPEGWIGRLEPLSTIDWRRDNSKTWEGRAMIMGKLSKSAQAVTLTTNVLKQTVGLPLSAQEQALEDKLLGAAA